MKITPEIETGRLRKPALERLGWTQAMERHHGSATIKPGYGRHQSTTTRQRDAIVLSRFWPSTSRIAQSRKDTVVLLSCSWLLDPDFTQHDSGLVSSKTETVSPILAHVIRCLLCVDPQAAARNTSI